MSGVIWYAKYIYYIPDMQIESKKLRGAAKKFNNADRWEERHQLLREFLERLRLSARSRPQGPFLLSEPQLSTCTPPLFWRLVGAAGTSSECARIRADRTGQVLTDQTHGRHLSLFVDRNWAHLRLSLTLVLSRGGGEAAWRGFRCGWRRTLFKSSAQQFGHGYRWICPDGLQNFLLTFLPTFLLTCGGLPDSMASTLSLTVSTVP